MHVRVTRRTNLAKLDAILLELLPLGVENVANLGAMCELARLFIAHPALVETRNVGVNAEGVGKLVRAVTQRIEALTFDHRRVHTVLTVQELNDVADAVTHGAVVLDDDVFHRLDETSLNVTSLGRFNGGIDQTFAATHGVEEELLRGQTAQVRVFDETTRFWTEIILAKVRQSSPFEPVRDTFAFYVLLSDARNHLRNVKERALRTGRHHHLDVVGVHE